MILSEQDRHLFYKIHPAVLTFVNQQKHILKDVQTVAALRKQPLNSLIELSDVLRFKEAGLNTAWFAIYDGLIVAGGKSKQDVEKNLKAIVPEKKWAQVYIFQFRSSG